MSTVGHQLAQLADVNVARLRRPLADPAMSKFVGALEDVNWLAEQSAGFVWRHATGELVTFGQLAGEAKWW